mgnify:CR=1 FL=1
MAKKWTALFVSVVIIAVLGACGGGSKNEAVDSNVTPTQEITIKATNFNFDQNEYRVKKGEPLKINFVNEQGNHGIEIKGLNVNLNGAKNNQVIIPEQSGEYDIICNIMCGSGHAAMVSKLIVE